MKRSFQILSAFMLVLCCCTGCFGTSLPQNSYPIYERTETEEDGIMVDIEGVVYKMYPLTKWEVHPEGTLVGYAGTKDTIISFAKDDTERNFIYLQDNGASMYYRPLYRTDREIPDPSGESVDLISWTEYDFSGGESTHYGRRYDDKETIVKLFDVWETGEKTWEHEFLPNFRIHMFCSSSQVPGAFFDLYLVKNAKQNVMMGNPDQGYTEVPTELLKEVSGHSIDVNKWTN